MIQDNRWDVTKEQKEKFIPLIREFMDKVKENPKTKEYIDFYHKGISPIQLKDILVGDLGFEEKDFERNGWEMDFWITLSKDGVDYMIVGTGITFEMIFKVA